MIRRREIWVDNLKVFACTLVVLGHFFQSMVSAQIISDSFIYQWFNKTIYYFQVPLFFICSGYLYQKYSDTSTFYKWSRNVLSKAMALLIPYMLFSIITWLLKNIFADSVNHQTNDLLTSLFWEPISPYWYLFSLFFIFFLIPVMKNQHFAISVILVAVATKVAVLMSCIGSVYILNIILGNIIWFVIGMSIFRYDLIKVFKRKICLVFAFLAFLVFFAISILLAQINNYNDFYGFLMGIAACFVFVVIAIQTEELKLSVKFASLCAKFTFPVFLMHTIFAATFRSVLNKLGFTNSYLHIIAGIFISFVGPVVTYIIASKINFIDFFFYPNKYISIKNRG